MSIFDKIRSFFCNQQQQPPVPDPLELLFEIPYNIPDDHVRQALTDHIEQWRCIVPLLKVRKLKGKMPDGYIAVMDFQCGGKSIRRQYLKIQREYVAIMNISYQQIFL